jgi:hypothetical protein
VKITLDDIRQMVMECIGNIVEDGPSDVISKLPSTLYHKSPIGFRKSILKNGLIPNVGSSYRAHYDGVNSDLKPYIFLYNHDEVKDGEYDSTYDDDIYAIDTSKLDVSHLHKDPDEYMRGCLVYDLKIPISAIKLVYRGSNKDSDDMSLKPHNHIY